MSKYVPPHQRNVTDSSSVQKSSGPKEEDRDDAEEREAPTQREAPTRSGWGPSDGAEKSAVKSADRGDTEPHGDRGGRKGGSAMDGGGVGNGGDWYKRSGGRRAEEPSELEVFGPPKTRSTAGIDFDKYEAIPVQVTGEGASDVKPISRFSEGRLSDSLFENLRRCGYDRPTPVQKYSIPIVVSGRDLMACAQTGSGKTCAFMVPCIESLLRSGPPPMQQGGRKKPSPCGLVLAPTRELAAQIHTESVKFAFDTGIRCCIIYGGADIREQRTELDRGCDILVATPGRLTDLVSRSYLSLGYIQFFILDEADRMLDMGFEPQVRQIVEEFDMGKQSRHRRQGMLFSATFPIEVQRMAQDFLHDYIFITVGRVGSASELVTQKVVYAEDMAQKVRALDKAIKDYLPKDGLCVVFVETKRGADSLEIDLHQRSVPVTAIHGDRSQAEREEALKAFKSGENPILVATDVAARGLDIPNVSLVVNFDLPKQLDDYVHRIGRTGRAGRKGVAVALVNERCTYLNELYDILVEAKQETPIWFEELCRSARRNPAPGGKGRGRDRFGGQDIRDSDGAPKKAEGPASLHPSVATSAPRILDNTPARASTAFGNTGQEDSW